MKLTRRAFTGLLGGFGLLGTRIAASVINTPDTKTVIKHSRPARVIARLGVYKVRAASNHPPNTEYEFAMSSDSRPPFGDVPHNWYKICKVKCTTQPFVNFKRPTYDGALYFYYRTRRPAVNANWEPWKEAGNYAT